MKFASRLRAGDDGYYVNAPKGYPCSKAAQQRRKSGKSRKKELKKLAAQRQRDTFEKSLPMSRAEFEGLFEFLDEGLAHRGYDGTQASRWSFCELGAR